MMQKILIANRGEIACRVIRTARRMGYRTVAVYSDADAGAPHVRLADEAVCIGPAAASASYLNSAALLDAAARTHADAVHPGYGFLSENAAFAQACLDAGLVFIGPPPEAIRLMGDKATAKRLMREAGVPTVPGYLGELQDDLTLAAEAERLGLGQGLPVLVKAVSGGGGRGMRLVRSAHELPQALASARREALSAFGDGTLMLERLIEHGRHIEVQVFADAHGAVVHLGERDCTAQRRRQKVIEEAPSPIVTPAQREALGRDAVRAAQAIGYRGAGTIEYIVGPDGQHCFLEMNTRLQVEHPVTEMVTGLDLVEWQLRVAVGEALPLTQADIAMSGHAIEARLYAEDPYEGFAPQTGTVHWWRPQPDAAAGVRIDDGIAEGGAVSPHYDPMVAKLIVHGHDRDDAIRRLMAALDAHPLLGLTHNGRFLRDLVDHPRFRSGTMHTGLIDEWLAEQAPLLQRPSPAEADWLLAAAVFAARRHDGRVGLRAPALRADSVRSSLLTLQCGAHARTLRVQGEREGHFRVADQNVTLLAHGDAPHGGRLDALIGGQRTAVWAVWSPTRRAPESDILHLVRDSATFAFREPSPWPDQARAQDPTRALAPVAGTVVQVLVQAGQRVEAGQPLLSIEAMKMEMWLHAQADGTVDAVHTRVGALVQAGALLVALAPDTSA
jgi:geranyl-CoA carboxylase alpha subunit